VNHTVYLVCRFKKQGCPATAKIVNEDLMLIKDHNCSTLRWDEYA
jgi:hypothetical protein